MNNAVNCVIDSITSPMQSFDMTGYTGVLSGASSIQVKGLTASTNVCKIAGTITWTGTLIFTPTSLTAVINFTSNGNLLTAITVTAGLATSLVVLQDDLSFTATKTSSLTLTTQALNLNGFTISGNSATNRLGIKSLTLGTPVALTVAGGTFANCDFRDINFANGGANLDLSGVTGGAGDCGGNGMSGGGTLTLTASTDRTWAYGGTNRNWSTANNWTGSVVPLPQDDVTLAETTTVTADMPRLGRDINFTAACPLTLGNAVIVYGSVDLTGMGTLAGSFGWTFESQTRSGTLTLTSGGKTFPSSININAFNTTLQLASALATNGVTTLNNGTFIDAGFTCTLVGWNSSNTNTRAVTKTGAWTIIGSGSRWTMTTATAPLTWSDTGSMIYSPSSAGTFNGGGLSYNSVTIAPTTGAQIIAGNNFFTGTGLTILAGKTVTPTAGTTQTVNSFTAIGTGANHITLGSATPGTPFTLTDADGGTNLCDYLDVTDCQGTPASTWYYGANGSADAYSLANGWAAAEVSTHQFIMVN